MNTEPEIPVKLQKEEERVDSSDTKGAAFEKSNFGTSALYGRTERNITFKQRGSHDENRFDNAFPGAYLEMLRAALRMIAMFFGKK